MTNSFFFFVNVQHLIIPHRDRISMSNLPFKVHVAVHAIAKNKRKTLTNVSSLNEDPFCDETLEVARKSWAGSHNESSSGSSPM